MPFAKSENIVPLPISEVLAISARVEKYKKGPDAKQIPDVTPQRDIYSVMMWRLASPSSLHLRKILEHLFVPLEMEVFHVIKDVSPDNQAQELATFFDMPLEQINDILESGFQKGVLFPKDRKTRSGYRFIPRANVQFHDGSLSNPALDLKYGPKLFNLWNDLCYAEEGYVDYHMQKERFEQRAPYGRRVLPAYEAILESPDVDQLQEWEDGREIIGRHWRWSTAFCSCRRRVSGGGFTCKRTKEHVCLNFDAAAETVILRHGREITKEEALEKLRISHRDGLVGSMEHYQTTNYYLLCFCCDDCCHHWAPHVRQWGDYNPLWRWQKSRWEPTVDMGVCDGCAKEKDGAKCANICQFKAIEMKELKDGYSGFIGAPGHDYTQKKKAVVDTEKCGGCLSCALVCPTKAIVAHCVKPVDWVPKEPQYVRKDMKRKEGIRTGFNQLYAE
ncbi:MAG: 4Fe-4S dicluster domain-containing protein [Chloroflexi bacterium]|nr:4Fe-4S dicluster domain-containing protein [Chloroflexota bacterium]